MCDFQQKLYQIRLRAKPDDIEIKMWKYAVIFDIYKTVIVAACECYILVEEAFQVVLLINSGKSAPPSYGRHHEFH
jgi:hypothetical protein